MGEDLEDAGAVGADAERQHHQAELAHGGTGDGAFEVLLEERPEHPQDGGHTTDDGQQRQPTRAGVEQGVSPGHQVDAAQRGTGGVKQRGCRRRRLGAPRKPRMQRKLRRLGGRPQEDQD